LQIKTHKVEAISIGATPATLQRSGEWVVVCPPPQFLRAHFRRRACHTHFNSASIACRDPKVSWRGVDSPSAGDWIGVYSPANASVTTSVPIKYKFADEVHVSCRVVLCCVVLCVMCC
jgi:hypothetical protein